MPDPFLFELVSPEQVLLSENTEMVVVPGTEGDFGVLIGHAPVISTLRSGVINIHVGNKLDKRIFVGGGFAEVTGERCTILAEEAIFVDDIDPRQAQDRLNVAQSALEAATDEVSRNKAEIELAAAIAMANIDR
ncbi:MAG: F0F1 ATP synthase subunit epsilon [Pseudomonadota bacterium]|nr:F0F1 ATP synthase subunit epsilon [Pseudomonadota bacterium]